MKSFEEIHTLLIEQQKEILGKDLGVEREKLTEVSKYKDTPFPVVISGLRRAGKSTLLAQLAHKFYPNNEYFYVNFEDDRFLNFTVSDFTKLHELLIELFGNQKTFMLDEIQNIDGWEVFVNRMIRGDYKFYITGSNASLLSKELGTKLTGRYIPIELFPFSWEEYLRFNEILVSNPKRLTTEERGVLKNALSDYLKKGGIPQSLQYPQLPIHKTLYDDIINRDIGARYKLPDTKPLRELSFYLLSNIAKLVSYNKMKELLKLGSVNTVSSYIDYLEASWLLFVVNRFAYSVKKQQIANKKIYCIDTGLTKSVAFSFSEDKGRFLENTVFLKLRRLYENDVYYYKTEKDHEVDFYLSKKKAFIQVSQTIVDPTTRKREIQSLLEAMDEIGESTGIIITEDEKETLDLEGKIIQVIPIYEWFLNLYESQLTLGKPETSILGDIPVLDIEPSLGGSGGPSGHFVHFQAINIGEKVAIDCHWGIRGFAYEWRSPDLFVLSPGEKKKLEYKIDGEKLFQQEVPELNIFFEYKDNRGVEYFTRRELVLEKVPSGAFYNITKVGAFHPAVVLKDTGIRSVSEIYRVDKTLLYACNFEVEVSGETKIVTISVSHMMFTGWDFKNINEMKAAIVELGMRKIRKMIEEGNLRDHTFTVDDFKTNWGGYKGYIASRDSI